MLSTTRVFLAKGQGFKEKTLLLTLRFWRWIENNEDRLSKGRVVFFGWIYIYVCLSICDLLQFKQFNRFWNEMWVVLIGVANVYSFVAGVLRKQLWKTT